MLEKEEALQQIARVSKVDKARVNSFGGMDCYSWGAHQGHVPWLTAQGIHCKSTLERIGPFFLEIRFNMPHLPIGSITYASWYAAVYSYHYNRRINAASSSVSFLGANAMCNLQRFQALGLRATIRYMGVKSFFCAPATKLSAARAKLSAVFWVPFGASPMYSRAPTKR